jgi:hypothetical protein
MRAASAGSVKRLARAAWVAGRVDFSVGFDTVVEERGFDAGEAAESPCARDMRAWVKA